MTRLRVLALAVVVQGCTSEQLIAVHRGDLLGDTPPSDAGVEAATEAAAAEAAATDAAFAGLTTSGSALVDPSGKRVRLTGVTWHGLDTKAYAPAGLWARPLADLVAEVKQLGYDSIRLPLTFSLLDANNTAQGPDVTFNPELVGLPGLQVLDRVVSEAEKNGLRVILCHSFWEPDVDEPLWFTAAHPESEWIADWRLLASLYVNRPAVVAFELHNAPHDLASTGVSVGWGDGTPTDWQAAATRAGNAILAINPRLLILVDGVQHVGAEQYWWGGNLQAVRTQPVTLAVPNHVVYATHDYPRSLSPQPWFSADATYYDALPPVWDKNWGYLAKEGIAPVFIAEFGTSSEFAWLAKIVGYAKTAGASFAYRAYNANNDPRIGGLLNPTDWTTVNQNLQQILAPALSTAAP